MGWFIFSVITLLCWSGSDFFSKIGCRDSSDKYSQFKMVMAVGLVMGLHAMFEIFVNGVEISRQVIWTYLPVSLLYIGSMTLGYVGLHYIALSISSYCRASVLWSRLFLKEKLSWKHYACIAVTFAGILIMGIYDM